MTIESIVPLVERIVDDHSDDSGLNFFSYRHAEEMHALGLKYEFTSENETKDVRSGLCTNRLITGSVFRRRCVCLETHVAQRFDRWKFRARAVEFGERLDPFHLSFGIKNKQPATGCLDLDGTGSQPPSFRQADRLAVAGFEDLRSNSGHP